MTWALTLLSGIVRFFGNCGKPTAAKEKEKDNLATCKSIYLNYIILFISLS